MEAERDEALERVCGVEGEVGALREERQELQVGGEGGEPSGNLPSRGEGYAAIEWC